MPHSTLISAIGGRVVLHHVSDIAFTPVSRFARSHRFGTPRASWPRSRSQKDWGTVLPASTVYLAWDWSMASPKDMAWCGIRHKIRRLDSGDYSVPSWQY